LGQEKRGKRREGGPAEETEKNRASLKKKSGGAHRPVKGKKTRYRGKLIRRREKTLFGKTVLLVT